MNKTIVGVDLAKKVIQVCIYTNRKVHSNTEMTPKEFTCWLVNSRPAKIVFEACGTSNYWKQLAYSHGHDARLISSRLVAVVRQNQKTDKNDALAIVQASLLPDVNFIQGKTAEQQQLQSIVRLRELSIRQKTASKNQLIALLSELNIQVSNRNGGLRATIDETLEDVDNGFSPSFSQAISTAWDQYSSLVEAIDIYDNCLEESLSYQPECKKLLKIEGVGTLNAVNLYSALGFADIGAFSKGKAAAACIGLTPIQHSSGGRAKIGSIGRGFKNTLFRSRS